MFSQNVGLYFGGEPLSLLINDPQKLAKECLSEVMHCWGKFWSKYFSNATIHFVSQDLAWQVWANCWIVFKAGEPFVMINDQRS